jgi:hypothetical protein
MRYARPLTAAEWGELEPRLPCLYNNGWFEPSAVEGAKAEDFGKYGEELVAIDYSNAPDPEHEREILRGRERRRELRRTEPKAGEPTH